MTNKAPMSNDQTGVAAAKREYDLEERTARFGESIIGFAKQIPKNPVTLSLISQVVRAGTSIGANYCEVDEAATNKEFKHRISLCKRESKETKFQIRMIVAAEPQLKEQGRILWQEAKELTRIFASILRKK
ncbi:MAG TPA: four helix bundle protein [Tepidisphaeraceae bacterium]|nr:four helix bundle protein [Tepidisphaeraceae bacterium]